MGLSKLLTELATGVTETIKIILPGAAEAVVDFGEKLMFSGQGDAATVTPVFGFITLGLCVTFGAWVVKRVAKKIV